METGSRGGGEADRREGSADARPDPGCTPHHGTEAGALSSGLRALAEPLQAKQVALAAVGLMLTPVGRPGSFFQGFGDVGGGAAGGIDLGADHEV